MDLRRSFPGLTHAMARPRPPGSAPAEHKRIPAELKRAPVGKVRRLHPHAVGKAADLVIAAGQANDTPRAP